MKYIYFVSYRYVRYGDVKSDHFAVAEMQTDWPITCLEHISALADTLATGIFEKFGGDAEVSILNYQLLRFAE